MADNVPITPGSGAIIAADEVTRNAILEKQQIIKIGLGAEGVHEGLAGSANPLPTSDLADQNLTDQLAHLVNALKFLSTVQGIAGDLRVTLLSGVVTTVTAVTTVTTVTAVTTVTTVTGQTNAGGFGLQHQVMNQMNTNAAAAIRNNITVT